MTTDAASGIFNRMGCPICTVMYHIKYSKPCVKQPLKTDKTKILMINGILMKGGSIAECSPWNILQYF